MARNKPWPGRLDRLPPGGVPVSASAALLLALLCLLWLPAAAMAAAAALVMAVWRPTRRSESELRKASSAYKMHTKSPPRPYSMRSWIQFEQAVCLLGIPVR